MAQTDKPVAIVCRTCGSQNVSRDAWASWDSARQERVLGAVFDDAHCHDCERKTRLDEVPLAGTCG